MIGGFEKEIYRILQAVAHAYHTRERNILSENEWAGWLARIRNAFRQGKLPVCWKEREIEAWFDPSFRDFINQEILLKANAP